MRKFVLLLSILMVCRLSFGQKKEYLLDILPLSNGKICYDSVISVPNAKKNALYNQGKLWFSSYFKENNDVLHIDDKEQGNIVGRWSYKVNFGSALSTMKTTILQNITLSFKDGKYRFEISAFTVSNIPGEKEDFTINLEKLEIDKKYRRIKFYRDIDENVKGLISNLTTFMITLPKSDW